MMKKCKIEVIQKMFNEELAKEYGAPGIGDCPLHKLGDTYITEYGKPDGLCDEAWKAMYQYVFALAHNCDTFYDNDWVKDKGVAICSCNDGLRPVIFKVTADAE